MPCPIIKKSKAITNLGYRIPFTTRLEAVGREVLTTGMKAISNIVNNDNIIMKIDKQDMLQGFITVKMIPKSIILKENSPSFYPIIY
jgi:alpha-D-ribose 1-methylphosphonate 5-phosphate C-P lyase